MSLSKCLIALIHLFSHIALTVDLTVVILSSSVNQRALWAQLARKQLGGVGVGGWNHCVYGPTHFPVPWGFVSSPPSNHYASDQNGNLMYVA